MLFEHLLKIASTLKRFAHFRQNVRTSHTKTNDLIGGPPKVRPHRSHFVRTSHTKGNTGSTPNAEVCNCRHRGAKISKALESGRIFEPVLEKHAGSTIVESR